MKGLKRLKKFLEWYHNPDKFFEDIFHQKPYPYQKRVLKKLLQLSNRILICAAGQCILEHEPIMLSNGLVKPIEEVKVGDEVLSIDKNGNIIPVKVINTFYSGLKEVLEIRTTLGNKLYVSYDHPLLSRNKWRLAKDFTSYKNRSSKYEVTMIESYDLCPYPISDNRIKLLALLLSEGTYGFKQTPKITNNNVSLLKEMEEIAIKEFHLSPKWYSKEKGYDLVLSRDIKKGTSPLVSWLRTLGIYGQTKENKQIPNIVFQLSNKQLLLFFQYFFKGDGHIDKYKRKGRKHTSFSIKLTTGLSKKMAIQMKLLLFRLGIYANIKNIKNTYQVVIPQWAFDRFHGKIKKGICYQKAKIVKSLGLKPVYNLETENGIFIYKNTIVHNTGKTKLLACIALWYATILSFYLKEAIEVIIISGSKSQARHLYEYCRDAILDTPELNEIVDGEPLVSKTRFKDRSIIRALSTSLKSIQGKGGDLIIIDEAVLAGDFFMKDSLRMITDKPYSKIIFSSTPQDDPKGLLFIEMWENKNEYPEWDRIHWDASECPGKKGLMEEAKKYGDYIYDVFWLGKPHPLVNTMIPREKIKEASRGVKYLEYNSKYPSEIGVDWGFGRSQTGIVVRQKINNVSNILEAIAKKHSNPVEVAKLIKKLAVNYNAQIIKCDAENKSENMRLMELGLPVKAIPFNRNKGLMQGHLRQLFMENRIRIKEDDVELLWQLNKYQYDTKTNDDLVDALMLACYEEERISEYSPIIVKKATPKKRTLFV